MTITNRRSHFLLAAILTGITAALVAGWLFGPRAVMFLPLGTFFLNALKMIVIPLVMTSMIVGVGSLGDVRRIGRTGTITIVYFMTTTGIAVALGLVLVNITQPGRGVDTMTAEVPERLIGNEAGVWDILLSFVHPSLFGAMADMKVLPVLVFSLAFGAALTMVGPKGSSLLDLIEGANDALLKVVDAVLWIAPIGVFGLVAGQIGKSGGFEGFIPVIKSLAMYSATVVGGLAIHGFIILPLILKLVARRKVFSFIDGAAPAVTTAFSTASSSATLPVSLDSAMGPCGVSPRSARFVLPLGATINMDGTALYEAVAALFIAQVYGIHLSLTQQIIVFAMATLAAVGAAGIPEAGLVTMVLVLTAVGLPIEGIGILLAVDWLLDRCRTSVNVWGDLVGSAVIERLAPPPPAAGSPA